MHTVRRAGARACGEGGDPEVTKLAQPVPCAFHPLCGTTMHDSTEGKAFRVAGRTIVACNRCVPRVQMAARGAVTLVGLGLKAFIDQRVPGLRPTLGQLKTAWETAQHGTRS